MKSLLIENFKNIKRLQLENLEKVNLIVGKNNEGKSTLLEAIALYLAQGVPSYLVQLLEHRGELTFRQDETDEERKEHFFLLHIRTVNIWGIAPHVGFKGFHNAFSIC